MGTYLRIESLSADGIIIDTADSAAIGSTNDTWQKISLSYQMPVNTVCVRFSIRSAGSGLLYADTVSLQETGIVLGENLISNPDFSTPIHAQTDWEAADGQFVRKTLDDDFLFERDLNLDANVLGIGGDPWGGSSARQTVTINGKTGERFFFAAWAMKMASAHWEGAAFEIRVEAPTADGSATEVLGAYSFNPYTMIWQYGGGVFTLDRDIEAVTVYLRFDRQPECASFDGVQLCRLIGS